MKLANKIAEKLAEKLGYNEEQRKVMAYGLCAAIQMIELLLISVVFGLVFNCLYECLIVFLGVGLMRKTTGGAHCSTYMACILTSSLSICLIALFCRYFVPCYLPKWFYVVFGMMPAFICFGVLAYKRVPQASKNKPITNPAKIKRLRRQCFATLLIYLMIAIVFLLIDWGEGRNITSLCALICVLYWQSFTLTSLSTWLAQGMDRLFTSDID